MDVLRSCYTTKCRFFRDNPTRESNIVWYFAPIGALALVQGGVFASNNYSADFESGSLNIGEVVGAPRPWRNGSSVGSGDGTHYCGSLVDFQQGAVFSDKPSLLLDADGNVACCSGLPVYPLTFASVPAPGQTWALSGFFGTYTGTWDFGSGMVVIPFPPTGREFHLFREPFGATRKCGYGQLAYFDGLSTWAYTFFGWNPVTSTATWETAPSEPFLPGTLVTLRRIA